MQCTQNCSQKIYLCFVNLVYLVVSFTPVFCFVCISSSVGLYVLTSVAVVFLIMSNINRLMLSLQECISVVFRSRELI